MSKKVKKIDPSETEGGTKLSPLDLNKIRFSDRHTVLTPDQLENRDVDSQPNVDSQPTGDSKSAPVTNPGASAI